jgi:mono/diheme cytochrome c family protein
LEDEKRMMARLLDLAIRRTPRVAGLAILAIALGGPRARSQSSSGAETGASLYTANCTICHGEDGSGTPFGVRLHVKDLNTKEVQEKSSAELAQGIRTGKDNMPPFGKRLDDEQIQKLVDYLKRKKPAGH